MVVSLCLQDVYITLKIKSLISHVIGLGILLVGFVLGRYVFFDVHGMKEFPSVLLTLGLVAIFCDQVF